MKADEAVRGCSLRGGEFSGIRMFGISKSASADCRAKRAASGRSSDEVAVGAADVVEHPSTGGSCCSRAGVEGVVVGAVISESELSGGRD